MKQNLITVWEKPHGNKFPSCYGMVDYAEWCKLVIEGFARNGRKIEIVKRNTTGEIALADNK